MNDFLVRLEAADGLLLLVFFTSAFFLALTVIEAVFDYVTDARPGWRESAANGLIELVNQLLERTVFGTAFVGGILLAERLSAWSLPMTWWSWCLALIAADLTYYWMHRVEHERRLFWAYHSVHHSSPEYNLTTALRLSWVEGVFEWIFFVPMALLGFDAVQIVSSILVVVVYQTWIHTEKIRGLGVVDRFLNTPSTHRVHHGRNPHYLDKNYGGILIVWDRIFGTYQAEDAPVDFGVVHPINSSNPLTINSWEFRRLYEDLAVTRGFRGFARILFGSPRSS